jgi:hypothetical protein
MTGTHGPCYTRYTEAPMNLLVHLPLRVHPNMKQTINDFAAIEGMRPAEYARLLLKLGIDQRRATAKKSGMSLSKVENGT